MRRLARHLFTLCSAASLLVCLAAAVFAVRGIWRSDWVNYAGHRNSVMAASIGSTGWYTYWADATIGVHGWHAGSDPATAPYFQMPPADHLHLLGLSLVRGRTAPSQNSPLGGNRFYMTLMVPHWMLALAAAVLPAFWLRRHRRHLGRLTRGLCPACGYDLRASPERCPECGAERADPDWG